jgi:hypothetical protein
MISRLLILLLLLASSVSGQQASYPFSAATSLPAKVDPSHFEFSTASYSYSISNSGRGVRKGSREAIARPFNLRLDRGDRLTRVIYHTEYQGDLLLICEATDDLYGVGYILRLDGRTLRIKWKRTIPAFNVGQGLIDDKYAYVTGVGFIGKVNLNSGVYVWRHRDLYRRSKLAFTSFELPELQGSLVVFRESPDYLRKKVAVIKVERTSGRIVSLDA